MTHTPGPLARTTAEDARLVAAAPELLEALEKLVDAAEDCNAVEFSLVIAARSAIAKAKGETQ